MRRFNDYKGEAKFIDSCIAKATRIIIRFTGDNYLSSNADPGHALLGGVEDMYAL